MRHFVDFMVQMIVWIVRLLYTPFYANYSKYSISFHTLSAIADNSHSYVKYILLCQYLLVLACLLHCQLMPTLAVFSHANTSSAATTLFSSQHRQWLNNAFLLSVLKGSPQYFSHVYTGSVSTIHVHSSYQHRQCFHNTYLMPTLVVSLQHFFSCQHWPYLNNAFLMPTLAVSPHYIPLTNTGNVSIIPISCQHW